MTFLRVFAVSISLLMMNSSTSYAESTSNSIGELSSVLNAFHSMLAGRILANGDGATLSFGNLSVGTNGRFFIETKMDFANGGSISATEVVRLEGDRVIMEQVVDGVATRRYEISVVQPYNILRTKPLDPDNSQFIARECLLKPSIGTQCYVKVRYMNDVIVSVFTEVHR